MRNNSIQFELSEGDRMSSARNDPCPCGSGKKYKHCCLSANQNVIPLTEQVGQSKTVEKVIDWLMERHRKAMKTVFSQLLAEMLDPQDMNGYARLDQETLVSVQINLIECLLAEGDILVQGSQRRVTDYLLGPSGPLLTVDQRDWLQQLAQRPLRLYDVTDVVSGVQMTLCDSLDNDAPPVIVRERSGTKNLSPGGRIACRVVRFGDHFEMSGAAYNFSMLAGQAVGSVLQAMNEELGHLQDLKKSHARVLMKAWLKQFVAPAPMPTLMDAYSGEPMLLVTDHYRVLDWQGLAKAMETCTDVFGDRHEGWDRRLDCDDGQTRATANIELGKKDDQIDVFYKTQGYADKGRAWFDAVAGGTVAFVLREVQDPKSLMGRGETASTEPMSSSPMDPTMLAQAIEGAIHRSYAHWADEPIPALGNKTPRQVMQTAAGLERVKGLIRSYETSEEQQAAQQGRPEVSYDFLWQSVGLSR
jgi:hypothetical protein